MPELTRDALFEALRTRHHYGTTGTRLFLDVRGTFPSEVTGFTEDPKLGATKGFAVREAMMGDIIRPKGVPMRLAIEVIGTASLDRVDVLHGMHVVQTQRPFGATELGRRVRVLWQGAEYRGRGRETLWNGKLAVTGNRIARFAPVNFLNPERQVEEFKASTELRWTSVTTGNLAGIDLWLDEAHKGTLKVETNILSGDVDLSTLTDDTVIIDGGGLGRTLSVYRLPEGDWIRHLTLAHDVTFNGSADLPVYVRVTQADGHQAWSSPVYLIE